VLKEFNSIDELRALVDQVVAVSDWITIEQDRIDQFATATGDHQWVHVDTERARGGPFGTTVAHGFLTVALLPWMAQHAMAIHNTKLSINYGFNRVRFPAAVPVGSRLRGHFKLRKFQPVQPLHAMRGVELIWEVTMEREGSDKPVCVAESISRRYY
jgi:acyl dehydratase